MNKTRRQHTVPRAYLKPFSQAAKNSHYIFTYEKRTGLIHKDNINNASVEKDWYTLKLSDNEMIWEEFYATEIEPRFEVIGKLIEKVSGVLVMNRAEIMDEHTRAEISILMIYQLFRGRIGLKYAEMFAHNVFPEVIDGAKAELGERIEELNEEELKNIIDVVSSKDFQRLIYAEVLTDPKRLLKYARLIANRSWVVFRVGGNQEFVTSDNPVAVGSVRSSDDMPSHLAFLNSRNVVYYPISPKLMIAAYDKDVFLGALEDQDGRLIILDETREEDFVDRVNKDMIKQCDRQAFARNEEVLRRYSK